MQTFREAYCAKHRCSPEQFARRVFWQSLYRHALFIAPLLLWLDYEYFTADRSLVSQAGDATSVARVREEVRDYFWDSSNRGWLRRTLKVRVSGQRLKNISRRYLAEGAPRTDSAAPIRPPGANSEMA